MAPNALYDNTATPILFDHAQDVLRPETSIIEARIVPGRLWKATVVAGDLLGAVAIVLCIPLLMLGIGIPIVLFVRSLLWIARLF